MQHVRVSAESPLYESAMRRFWMVLSLTFAAACAHTPSVVPARDPGAGELYVTRKPGDCAVSDLSLEILNRGPYALEVYWVVGRRSGQPQSGRYRVGRGVPGRTVIKLPENIGRLVLSNVEGHWDVPPVKSYRNGYSLTLGCVTSDPMVEPQRAG